MATKRSRPNIWAFVDFGLPPDIVGASLGDLGVQDVAGLEAMVRLTLDPTKADPTESTSPFPSLASHRYQITLPSALLNVLLSATSRTPTSLPLNVNLVSLLTPCLLASVPPLLRLPPRPPMLRLTPPALHPTPPAPLTPRRLPPTGAVMLTLPPRLRKLPLPLPPEESPWFSPRYRSSVPTKTR